MQVKEENTAKQELEAMREKHKAWKRLFFRPRAPLQHLGPVRKYTKKERRRMATFSLSHAAMQVAQMRSDEELEANKGQAASAAPAGDEGERRRDGQSGDDDESTASERKRHEREEWNPHTDEQISSDPRKTMIVAKLSPETSEVSLRQFGERFGRVVNVRVVKDDEERSRGYGFVEFSHNGEMLKAVRTGDGSVLDGRKVKLDVERARLFPSFVPKRFRSEQQK